MKTRRRKGRLKYLLCIRHEGRTSSCLIYSAEQPYKACGAVLMLAIRKLRLRAIGSCLGVTQPANGRARIQTQA